MPEVTLDIPQEIYQRAQKIAEERHRAVQDILVESIILEEEVDWKDISDDEVAWREEKAFQQLHPYLLKNYPGEYVAIINGEVIDHDTDQVALYQRVSKRFPERFILLAKITPRPIEEYTFRSPRLTIE